MTPKSLFRATFLPTLVAASLVLIGCSPKEFPVEFEANLVHSMKYELKEGFSMQQASDDAMWVTEYMFGTANDPKIPDFITEDDKRNSIVSLERLVAASGAADEAGRGLFRKHCVVCHGVTGDGRGPTAAVQTPYPRDYRMGVFKFKSTPRGVKPTREDLSRVVREGIAGTAMKKIPELSEDDIQALVDYVIYLSWRGEFERTLIDVGVRDWDLEGGDRVTNVDLAKRLFSNEALREELETLSDEIDGDDLADYGRYIAFQKRLSSEPGFKGRLEAEEDPEDLDDEAKDLLKKERKAYKDYNKFAKKLEKDPEMETEMMNALTKVQNADDIEQFEIFNEMWEYNIEYVQDIADEWLEAKEDAVEVPEPPAGLPLANSYEEYQQLAKGDQATQLAASVERGRELFTGKIASCSKCHGEKGLGNGQTNDYDDWTKDWTTRFDFKPEDRDSLVPMLARGALPPVNAIPRNFQEGIFRGGSTSADLYLRITQGIDGTPMPAATFVPEQFEKDEVWHIINFIRSLQTTDAEAESEPKKVEKEA